MHSKQAYLIYNRSRGEFLRFFRTNGKQYLAIRQGDRYLCWTVSPRHAQRYTFPSNARHRCQEINNQLRREAQLAGTWRFGHVDCEVVDWDTALDIERAAIALSRLEPRG